MGSIGLFQTDNYYHKIKDERTVLIQKKILAGSREKSENIVAALNACVACET